MQRKQFFTVVVNMLFNSIEFLIFFPIVFVGFYFLPHKFRWGWLLMASWYFYASFRFEYFYLIIISTFTAYFSALLIEKSEKKGNRKLYLILNLIITLGLLVYFKYFNLFAESINTALNSLKSGLSFPVINVMLPIGISFYTFQVIGYTLDVYWRKSKPERHAGIFALYVSFFPQLVAGPIERADRLIPQLRKVITFDYEQVKQGCILILWGFLQKVAIADRIALVIDPIFDKPSAYNGLQLILAMVLFAFQIYNDFAGYTNIALGTAQTMGVSLMDNFNRPFASKNITEFWRRWHISLSTWARDYLYLPISYSKRSWGKFSTIYAATLTFSFLGIWHGANWTYLIFGLLMGIIFYYEIISSDWRQRLALKIPAFAYNTLSKVLTFSVLSVLLLLFRIKSFTDFAAYFTHIADNITMTSKTIALNYVDFAVLIGLIGFAELLQYAARNTSIPKYVCGQRIYARWSFYMIIAFCILIFGAFNLKQFYYFQF